MFTPQYTNPARGAGKSFSISNLQDSIRLRGTFRHRYLLITYLFHFFEIASCQMSSLIQAEQKEGFNFTVTFSAYLYLADRGHFPAQATMDNRSDYENGFPRGYTGTWRQSGFSY